MALARRCTVTALGVAVVALYGCGTQTPRRPGEQAAGVARAFLSDCARAEVSRADDLLTPRARTAFGDGQASGMTACLRFLRLTTSDEALTASQQREILRRATAETVPDNGSAKVVEVVIEAPGGRRQRLRLEQRAGEWLLTKPVVPAHEREEVRSERAARNAVASFSAFCTRHQYRSAETLLSASASRDFEATGGKAAACLMFLGLSKPSEALSPSERDDLLRHAEIGDISDVEPGSAKVSVTVPPDRVADVAAESTGQLWRLTKPDGSPRDAAKSLLDSCSHLQYETAAEMLTKSSRTDFLVHGGHLEACLRVLHVEQAGDQPHQKVRAALDEATVSVEKSRGDAATLRVDVPDHGRRELRAERDGDEWKVAGMAP